jgi:hypothetical protein
MLNYIFRKPEFPIICNFDGIIVAAKSEVSFTRQLDKLELDINKSYHWISVSGEGWMFLPQHLAVSPLSVKKKWFKKDIIALYNGRKNSGGDGNQYSNKSLSAKRFEKIFKDIVELLLKS